MKKFKYSGFGPPLLRKLATALSLYLVSSGIYTEIAHAMGRAGFRAPSIRQCVTPSDKHTGTIAPLFFTSKTPPDILVYILFKAKNLINLQIFEKMPRKWQKKKNAETKPVKQEQNEIQNVQSGEKTNDLSNHLRDVERASPARSFKTFLVTYTTPRSVREKNHVTD